MLFVSAIAYPSLSFQALFPSRVNGRTGGRLGSSSHRVHHTIAEPPSLLLLHQRRLRGLLVGTLACSSQAFRITIITIIVTGVTVVAAAGAAGALWYVMVVVLVRQLLLLPRRCWNDSLNRVSVVVIPATQARLQLLHHRSTAVIVILVVVVAAATAATHRATPRPPPFIIDWSRDYLVGSSSCRRSRRRRRLLVAEYVVALLRGLRLHWTYLDEVAVMAERERTLACNRITHKY